MQRFRDISKGRMMSADADDREKKTDEDGADSQNTRRQKHLTIMDVKDLEPWKRKKVTAWFFGILVLCLVYLGFATCMLIQANHQEKSTWYTTDNAAFTTSNEEAAQRAKDNGSTEVLVGTYIESINSVSIKSSEYNVTLQLWFRWDGDPDLDMADNFTIYKGSIKSKDMLAENTVGTTHYQLMRVNVTLNKVFYTARFPLESHQLRIYVESSYPSKEVVFVADSENSSLNSGAMIAGYNITNVAWGLTSHEYDSTHSDPTLTEPPVTSEYITAITIERSGFGLFFKCFIAMYGTTTWVLIMLYICGHHHVDPLGMIPAALFGTVSNIMVGASLLPDALDLGLLEYVNIWGVATIVICAMIIIEINNIRSEHGRKDENFARFFGRLMFWEVLPVVVFGNVLLPLVAWL